jgi:hypothetical protein
MQIVQFVVDLHLVYFGSESNVFDVAIHLMRLFPQPITISRPPIGLIFRHLAAAMEQSRLLSLVAHYSRAIFCSLSSSILIRTRSQLAERNQLRTDTQMGMRWFILIFDSDPRLMALLNAGSRKIKDVHREKVRANGRTGRWGEFFFIVT